MLRPRHREKLIEAAVFFAGNTRHCGKIKLIKLLYLMDFEHFRQTGRSVTGLEYRALRMGPVPMDLFEEWEALQPDFAEAVEIVPEQVFDYVRDSVRPRRAFDDSHFSPRELQIMQALADKFQDEYSRPLINYTHAELGPWSAIWDSGRGNLQPIPYRLALAEGDANREAVLEAADEYDGLQAASSLPH